MSRQAIVRSIHQRLLNVRDRTGEPFNRLLVKYGLERLLYRLQASGHAESFVLKGAMLFALWQDVRGRPTRDIDLLGIGDLTHERLRKVFNDVCSVEVEADGLHFDADSLQTDDIRDDQEYHGIRVKLIGFLGKARIPIQVDVGFGDTLIPAPEEICYPTLLNLPAPYLQAYHPATVIAEKFNAMVVLGQLNSRLKDFYDTYVILTSMEMTDELLREAIYAAFNRRLTPLPESIPVAFTADFLEDGSKETQWRAFLNRSDLESFPYSLAEVTVTIWNRLAPVLSL